MKNKERYEVIRKKYKSLPAFERIDLDFELQGIEENAVILREVRKLIMEKLEGYAQYINELLQPEATMANLRESEQFSQKEKKEMYELYKKLMIAHRGGMEIAIMGEEKAHVTYIVEICKDWDKVKKQMMKIIQKVQQAWLKDTKVDPEVSYFG